ncbi:MAG TPA: zinc ribbon domain-containing protein [Pyrinomonadaceae bacterium]|jgi:hypothetical protein
MFCPNCGAKNTTEQKFCRSCGLRLEQITVALLEQIASPESAELFKRQRRLENFGNIAFGGFALVLLTGVSTVIYFILTRMIFSGENVFFGILLIAFIVFAISSLIYVIFSEDVKERKPNPILINELTENRETGKLLEEKPFAPASSVTESSTELLYTKNKTRKLK